MTVNWNFNWEKAKSVEVGYSHYDGEILAFAAGKEDWLPIAVAIFTFHQSHCGRGHDMLSKMVQQEAWIPHDDTRITDWLKSNERCLSAFQRFSHEKEPLPFDERKAKFRHPSALSYSPFRMAEAYISARQRAYPPIENDIYWVGDEVGEDYWCDPEIAAARNSAYHAFEVTKDFAATWFEARGFEVNRADRCVRVPGYRPLCTLEKPIL